MNPGSVVYTSTKRAVLGGKFEVPDDERLSEVIAASIESGASVDDLRKIYNRWGWGMERLDRYAYLEKDSREAMVARFRRRAVAYLIGEDDIELNPKDEPSLLLQGPHRLERSRLMEIHLKDEGVWNSSFHVRKVVPGVGHSGKATMTSPLGLWYIFGYEAQTYPSLEFFPGEAALSEILEILRRMGGRVPVDPPSTAPSSVPVSSADPAVSLSGSLASGSLAREPLGRARNLEVLTRGTAFARRERS